MSPLLIGALGAGAGVALWELLLKPAPIDNVLFCATRADADRAVSILDQYQIPNRIQQAFGDTYAVLTKKGDFLRAAELTHDVRRV